MKSPTLLWEKKKMAHYNGIMTKVGKINGEQLWQIAEQCLVSHRIKSIFIRRWLSAYCASGRMILNTLRQRIGLACQLKHLMQKDLVSRINCTRNEAALAQINCLLAFSGKRLNNRSQYILRLSRS